MMNENVQITNPLALKAMINILSQYNFTQFHEFMLFIEKKAANDKNLLEMYLHAMCSDKVPPSYLSGTLSRIVDAGITGAQNISPALFTKIKDKIKH